MAQGRGAAGLLHCDRGVHLPSIALLVFPKFLFLAPPFVRLGLGGPYVNSRPPCSCAPPPPRLSDTTSPSVISAPSVIPLPFFSPPTRRRPPPSATHLPLPSCNHCPEPSFCTFSFLFCNSNLPEKLTASSTSSCSALHPKSPRLNKSRTRQHSRRVLDKMALIWNERNTRRLLDLISDEQKQQNRWSEKRRDPTKHGWDNIFRRFSETRRGGRSKKDDAITMQQMENHWTQLKSNYYDWSEGLKVTGKITYDRVLQAARDRVKSESMHPIPMCCEQLHIILGRDWGATLESAGGGYTSIDDRQPTPTKTTSAVAPTGSAAAGRSSKRSNVIDSESVQNTIRPIDRAVEHLDNSKRPKTEHELGCEEIEQVMKVLEEDGVSESDEYFAMACVFALKTIPRFQFLSTKTKEGRRNLVDSNVKWKGKKI